MLGGEKAGGRKKTRARVHAPDTRRTHLVERVLAAAAAAAAAAVVRRQPQVVLVLNVAEIEQVRAVHAHYHMPGFHLKPTGDKKKP